jgi:hypothetical protein
MMVAETEITNFVFPNGRVVGIKKVSPFTLLEAKKMVIAPRPPMQKVSYGDHETEEPNASHPDYLAAVVEFQERLNKISLDLVVKRGVWLTLDESERAQVADLRAYWKEEFDVELPGTDEYLFVVHFCITDSEVINGLVDAVTGMGQPTPEQIQQAKDMFPGIIPG